MSGNDDQIAYWNGPIGEKWARFQTVMDANLSEASDAALALAAPKAGERVLDIGCGAGTTSRALAAMVGPSGRVTAVDVSRPLLTQARSAAVPANLEFLEADASVQAFGADHDLLVSRFGVMFFDVPAAAFAHLRGALKPGGRLAFVCWRPAAQNEWVSLPLEVAMRFVPPQPPADPHAPGPFAFADPERLRGILAKAGFKDIAITPFDGHMNLGTSPADAAFQVVNLGPTARLLHDADDDTRAKVEAAVREMFAGRQKDGEAIRPAIACWLVAAKA